MARSQQEVIGSVFRETGSWSGLTGSVQGAAGSGFLDIGSHLCETGSGSGAKKVTYVGQEVDLWKREVALKWEVPLGTTGSDIIGGRRASCDRKCLRSNRK